MTLHKIRIRAPDAPTVSAILLRPPRARACFVFAHGAGADMNHPFMQAIAEKLAASRIATLRYQFPYMEAHAGRPDRPAVCHSVIRAAVATAHEKMPQLPLIAGGKSFGGRMTSQAQALTPLPKVVGLAFFGFPWHLPGQPALTRAEHLSAIRIPMLFLQGARDAMAVPRLVEAQVPKRLKGGVLHWVAAADHGFQVLVRSGRTASKVEDELVGCFAKWTAELVGRRRC